MATATTHSNLYTYFSTSSRALACAHLKLWLLSNNFMQMECSCFWHFHLLLYRRICVSLIFTTRIDVYLYRMTATAAAASTLNNLNAKVLRATVRVHVIVQTFWIFICRSLRERREFETLSAEQRKKFKQIISCSIIIGMTEFIIIISTFLLLLFLHPQTRSDPFTCVVSFSIRTK